MLAPLLFWSCYFTFMVTHGRPQLVNVYIHGLYPITTSTFMVTNLATILSITHIWSYQQSNHMTTSIFGATIFSIIT